MPKRGRKRAKTTKNNSERFRTKHNKTKSTKQLHNWTSSLQQAFKYVQKQTLFIPINSTELRQTINAYKLSNIIPEQIQQPSRRNNRRAPKPAEKKQIKKQEPHKTLNSKCISRNKSQKNPSFKKILRRPRSFINSHFRASLYDEF